MRKLIAFAQVAILAVWESCSYILNILRNINFAEAFPKTEAFQSESSARIIQPSFQEGSCPKTVTINRTYSFHCKKILYVFSSVLLLLAPPVIQGQDPVPGCDIGIVPDDLDMQDRIQVNLDEDCTACGPYGGSNGTPGDPPRGQTGCAIIQIREEAMTECMTLIVDPQSTEKTNYYFDYNLMVDDCFTPNGETDNQNETVTFMRDELILNNGFYSLVVCSQSTGNRFYEVVLGCCPDAGEGSSVTLCNGDQELIDLASLLTGADPGGTWGRTSGVGGVFDAEAGTFEVFPGTTTSTFTYSLEPDPRIPDCDPVTTVTVFIEGPTTGVGSETSVCNDSPNPVDLFSLLSGADPGGMWIRKSGTGGTFDDENGTYSSFPGGTTSIFTYSLVDPQFPECTPSTDVTVNVGLPNSGIGSSISVCDQSGEVIDLFSLLSGADPGGMWIRTSGTGGTFDDENGTFMVTPGTVTSTFLYTVEYPDDPDCSSSTEVTVVIEDVLEPDIVCDDLIVALSFNNPEIIDADSLLESATDECGWIVSIKAIRMGDPLACGYPDTAEPSDSVAFCCADVGQTVTLTVFVTDNSDNTASCMADVMVVDNVPPLIMSCVDDITVSCAYDIDLDDLSAFGNMEAFQEDVDEIIIDDPEFMGSGRGGRAFDGMYLDNCPEGTDIDEFITDLRECNRGDIERKFVITDGWDNKDSCTQTITIIDTDRMEYEDIEWPEDVPYEDCEILNPNPGPTPHPNETGWPTYNLDDICSQPMASYTDMIFDDPTSGCIKIERRWKVIDWCYYDPVTRDGSWIYYQYIKIINTVAPTFDDTRDTLRICAPGSSCSADHIFEITATDDCTADEDLLYWYKADIDNDGDIDAEGTGNSFSVFLEAGTHRVIWTVEDRCGNYTEKEQIVIFRECKAPTPICYWGLAASLSAEGETLIWAKDFNNKSNDNCTLNEDLVFSFSSDTSDTSLPLDCENLGEVEIQLWVTDEAGNQSYCETYIEVQDNHEVCDQEAEGERLVAAIAGNIITEFSTPVKETQVNISGPELDTYQMTDKKGAYTFNNLDTHYDYEIIPVKDDNPLDGVSTLDLVMVQQHILGIRPLDGPYKKIAADINNSGSITANDLVALRKMILGLHDAFPENNSWRFVEANYGILEPESPWSFVEGVFLEDLSEDMMHNDFIAVKIGDVNNSIEENLQRKTIESRADNGITLKAENIKAQAGEMVNLVVSGTGINKMIALQWTITIDNEALTLDHWTHNSLDLDENNTAIIQGEGQHFTVAWTDLEALSLSEGESLLTLSFQAQRDVELKEAIHFSSMITSATGYNADFEKVDMSFDWLEEVPGETVLYQNAPNPFLDKTAISFNLPKDMEASIELHDISGKLLYQKNDFYNRGKNTIFVSSGDINNLPGVVYYTLKTEYNNITKKMILLR